MNVDYSKSFDEQFRNLSRLNKQSVRDAVELFIDEPFHISLRNHPLKEQWRGYRSISADDDLRLHFKMTSKSRTIFVAVGSHNQLYK
jgi:addiction module RelE/StbE family toxin